MPLSESLRLRLGLVHGLLWYLLRQVYESMQGPLADAGQQVPSSMLRYSSDNAGVGTILGEGSLEGKGEWHCRLGGTGQKTPGFQ